VRAFSKSEQDCIRKLVANPDLNSQGFVQLAAFFEVNYFGPAHSASIECRDNELLISFPEEGNYAKRKRLSTYVELFNLLMILADHGLIYITGDIVENGSLGAQHATTVRIEEPHKSFVLANIRKWIWVSEDLRVLVSSGFRTAEQKRHEEMKWTAWTAIAVSLMLGLLGVGLQLSR
jgi:hypothetical protein